MRGVLRTGLAALVALGLLAGSASAAALRGQSAEVEAYDDFGSLEARDVLGRISYRETATAQQNDLSYVPLFTSGRELICNPFGPGCLASGSVEDHVFVDRGAAINRATGGCEAVAMALASVADPRRTALPRRRG